ncbi:MAG: hypothetical protein WA843_01365, partial [Candidatus Saccharimonadales bacterium]
DENSTYLGDGVYGHVDDHNRTWIVTYNGISISNKICLDPEVFEAAIKFYHSQERWYRKNPLKRNFSFVKIEFDEDGEPII